MTNPSIASDLTGLISSCRAFALQTQPFGVAGVLNDAAEALSQLTREVADYRSALSEAEDMLVRARDKRKLFGLQHAIEAVQAALSRSSGGAK